MTQSGQGEEPSAREAREGIVLPSDGGEPLLPGMTGGHGDAPQGHTPDPSYGQAPGSASGQTYGQGQGPGSGYDQGHGQGAAPAYGQNHGQGSGAHHGQPSGSGYGQAAGPAGGQAWGTPWGPDQQQNPAPPPGQGWSAPPAQSWGTQDNPDGQALGHGAGTYGPSGTGAPARPAGYDTDEPTSYYLPPVGQAAPQAPSAPAGTYGPSAPLPPADGYGGPASGSPLPPAAPGTTGSGQPHAGHTAHGNPGVPGGAPLPPADEGATQYIPPVAAAPGDEGATQYLPPVGPGALPPEAGAETPAESTQFLGRAPQGGSRPGAGPLPPAAGPDAEATQYIAPVPGQQPAGAYGGQQDGDRQPPAEFDSLFRSGAGAAAPPTQRLPRLQEPEAAGQPPYGQSPQPSYAPPGGGGGHGGGRGGRTGSRVPVIAAVGIGIAVLGIGAGALLAGGGGDDGGDGKKQTVSATAPATDGSASPSADPAEQQAVALDKLLADSGSSRSTVINAVEDVKSCKNLGQAAQDLRGAARQRTGLVTQLSKLSVDKLPDHAALTDALTKAWQASASADSHYAAWADQAAGKKGCKKGQARTTAQTQAGNQASGTASKEKVKAAELWNAIAKTYGLTERRPTQL